MGRNPKVRNGGEWTEARFWGFIRSLLRQGSIRWRPRNQCEERARRPAVPEDGYNKQTKWVYQCCECKCWKNRKGMEIDHIIPAGELRKAEDLPGFVSRLFCEVDGFQMLCIDCNNAKKEAVRKAKKDAERTLFD